MLSREFGSAQESVVSDGGISDAPIPARLGWQSTAGGLRLAWQLVIDDASAAHLWNATVDAENGDLLAKDDWTDHDSREGLESRLGRANGQTSSAVAALVQGPTVFETSTPVADGSTYRIYPGESPDDTERVLEASPADGIASPFGWHDTDGLPGAEFTITRGNNVHAYIDRDNDNLPDPTGEPNGGPGLDFDFAIDLGEHAQYNVSANITNLFRWCNVVHDLMYLYGFDDPAANFQTNNYGRGGVGGDAVRCEGMDGSGESNANFSTPAADGGAPRMQTFIEFGSGLPSAVTVESGPAAGTYLAAYARFTPPATTAGTSGTLVLVNDGVGSPTDGCTAFTLPAGSIAVLDTVTTCNNRTQVANAESAGAVAVVVIHDGEQPDAHVRLDEPAGDHPGDPRRPRLRQHDQGGTRDGDGSGPCASEHRTPAAPHRRSRHRHDHPRVRPWRLEPPHRPAQRELPHRAGADGRGLGRLLRDGRADRHRQGRPGSGARHLPVRRLRAASHRARPAAPAVLPEHADPAGDVRLDQDERLASELGGQPDLARRSPTASGTPGRRSSGTWRGI